MGDKQLSEYPEFISLTAGNRVAILLQKQRPIVQSAFSIHGLDFVVIASDTDSKSTVTGMWPLFRAPQKKLNILVY